MPWPFSTGKTCWMIQRCLYQPTILQASATVSILCVVSSSQCKGSTPLGGFCSMTSTKLTLTLLGKSFSSVFLVSVREHIESHESFVIQERWPDSKDGHRCGLRTTASDTTA